MPSSARNLTGGICKRNTYNLQLYCRTLRDDVGIVPYANGERAS